MNTAPSSRYTGTAIVLHWVLGVALLISFGVGLYMAGLPLSPWRLKLYNWHKWAGMTILALSALRLVWRLAHRPPDDLPMPAWQVRVAHLTHNLLYALFFLVPLVGWAYSSAAGFPIVVFGVLPLPDFVPADKALAEAIKPWHEALAWLMVVLVLAHAVAALKHHIVDRDGLMSRMWINKKPA
ncbi:MAG TPA: cytochrome b [Albitalea sp.]|nr:cytochrome b [Albitalea sp.]